MFSIRPAYARRAFLLSGIAAIVLPWQAAGATEQLTISGDHGTIDFSIGDSKIFRTTGSFKRWQGKVKVDDNDVPNSSVDVTIDTRSLSLLDPQQTDMLKDTDFFDVVKFPEMTFHSKAIERLGEDKLKVMGEVTLRGITKPMVLIVSVTDRKPDAAPGTRYARFRGEGQINRSDFGITKFVDVVGDKVDISIRTDAVR
jgi:polyisoprenoid-binding protein YceI